MSCSGRDRAVALGTDVGLDGVFRTDGAHDPASVQLLRGRGLTVQPQRAGGTGVLAGTSGHDSTLPSPSGSGRLDGVRVVVAECQVDYGGRLTAHLPMARRLIMVKADGSVSVHADDRAYKPLNWMSPPCTLTVLPGDQAADVIAAEVDPRVNEVWMVRGKNGDSLQISLGAVELDHTVELGVDPGLQKDGVEAHLQALLAENPATFGAGWSLVQREYMTAIGPVDLLCRDEFGVHVAVEVKRRGEIDGVEQLTRYLELMNRDPLLGEVRGVFAAQQIKPQARTLATDRGISCVVVDYDALRGVDNAEDRLF